MLRSQDRKWLSMLRQKRFQFQLCLCNRCPAWKHGGVQHSQNVDDQRSVVACGLSELKRIDSVNVYIAGFQCFPLNQYWLQPLDARSICGTKKWRPWWHPFKPQQALWCGLATNSRLWARCRELDYLRKGWMSSSQAFFSIETSNSGYPENIGIYYNIKYLGVGRISSKAHKKVLGVRISAKQLRVAISGV